MQTIWCVVVLLAHIEIASSLSLQLVSKNNSYVPRIFDVLLEIQYLAEINILPFLRICVVEDEVSDTCVEPTGSSVKVTLDYQSSARDGEMIFLFRLCQIKESLGRVSTTLYCSAPPVRMGLFLLPQSRIAVELLPYFYHKSLNFAQTPSPSASINISVSTGPVTHAVLMLHAVGRGVGGEGGLGQLVEQVLRFAGMGLKALSVVAPSGLSRDPALGAVLLRLCTDPSTLTTNVTTDTGQSSPHAAKYGSVSGVMCCDTAHYHHCAPASTDVLYVAQLDGGLARTKADLREGHAVLRMLRALHHSVRRHVIVVSISHGEEPCFEGLCAAPDLPGQLFAQWLTEKVGGCGGACQATPFELGAACTVTEAGHDCETEWDHSAIVINPSEMKPNLTSGPAVLHPLFSVFGGVPSRALFSIDYGLNIAVLDNVCSSSTAGHRTSLNLFVAAGDSGSVLSTELDRVLNESTNSGFYTANPEQSGWRFTEEAVGPIGPAQVSPSHAAHAHLFTGVTVALSSPFGNNIFHITQVLATLFHLKLYGAQLNINHRRRGQGGHDQRYRQLGEDWANKLDRVNMPTFSRSRELEWSSSLLAAVTALVSVQPSSGVRITGADIAAYFGEHMLEEEVGTDSRPESRRLSVYTQEDYESLAASMATTSNGKESNFCYDKLVICGTMELSVAFISSTEDADLFRQFVYGFFNIDMPDVPVISHPAKPSPNRKLNVVILLRSQKKNILNIPAVLSMLRHTGLVTVPDAMLKCWHGSSHNNCAGVRSAKESTVQVYFFDFYPLAHQVRMLAQTDLLITPHGAGVMNLIYLRRHSAVIEVMTSPWYELGYQATAVGMGLAYFVLPVTSKSVVWDQNAPTGVRSAFQCPYPVPPECFHTNLLLSRRELVCYNIRLCDISVDTEALEVLVWQSSQVIRLFKADIQGQRMHIASKSNYGDEGATPSDTDAAGTGAVGVLEPHTVRMYRKAYVRPLDEES